VILSKTEHNKEGETEPNKILIFSEWTDVLDVLEYFLKLRNIACLRFDGTVDEKTKKMNLKIFPNRNSPPVLLISLHAGGVGLNLQCANYVIIVEPYWNKSMEDQAVTRSHRIGQKRPVKVIHFIADKLFGESSIEQHVHSLQQRKSLHSSVFFQNTLNIENPFPQLTLGYKRIVENFRCSFLDEDDAVGASPNYYSCMFQKF
jgi:SNF2 family DNA or RNA helicase